MKNIFLLIFFICCWVEIQAQPELRKANRYYKYCEYAAAIPLYKAVYEDNQKIIALRRLAYCYLYTANYQNAEKYFAILVEKQGDPEDIYHYGYVLKANGKYAKAKEQFLAYARKKPGSTKGNMMAASCDYAMQLLKEKPLYTAKSASEFNTSKSEYAPTFYKDNVIYTSTRETASNRIPNTRSGEPADRFYIRSRLEAAANLQSESFSDKLLSFSIPYTEGIATFSPEGNVMYFTRSTTRNINPDLGSQGVNVLKIYRAELVNGYWTNIKELPFNSNNYNCAHPSLSKDGKELYFASDMPHPDRVGGIDLYVVRQVYDKKGRATWSKPINLGKYVNSEGDEVFPYIHSDGTLYFSSNFHPGLGGLDLFQATKKGDIYTDVVNLKNGINSSADDFGIVLNKEKNKGYISSNRSGGFGGDDIYQIQFIPPRDTQFIITGKVTEQRILKYRDKYGKEALLAQEEVAIDNSKITLQLQSKNIEATQTNRQGEFNFKLNTYSPDKVYTVISEKAGRNKQVYNISPSEITIEERENADIFTATIKVQHADRDTFVTFFETVYFALGQHTLSPESEAKIREIARQITKYPVLQLEIEGHTCTMGKPHYNNQALSERRAQEVAEAIIKASQQISGQPLDPYRITVYGSSFNKTIIEKGKENYEKSRRAEVSVTVTPIEKTYVLDKNGYYVVQPGATLYSIAKYFNTTVEELVKINKLKNTKIVVGQKLRVKLRK
ncbi:MAG: OmpA family protein [Bacteroidia bacterium]|nr:OmpA family protein [Bacteroidia bacterium]MDW8159055.1 OmpA family protein [Bacteroidia bacterium]